MKETSKDFDYIIIGGGSAGCVLASRLSENSAVRVLLLMHCPRCEMPLTYHAGEGTLLCHHCNYRLPNPAQCPACQSTRIRFFGAGTTAAENDA